jgi:hypothetical protein
MQLRQHRTAEGLHDKMHGRGSQSAGWEHHSNRDGNDVPWNDSLPVLSDLS